MIKKMIRLCVVVKMIIYMILALSYYLKTDSNEYLLPKKQTNKIKAANAETTTINETSTSSNNSNNNRKNKHTKHNETGVETSGVPRIPANTRFRFQDGNLNDSKLNCTHIGVVFVFVFFCFFALFIVVQGCTTGIAISTAACAPPTAARSSR